MTASGGHPSRSENTNDEAQSEIEIFVNTESTTMKLEKNRRTPGLKRRSRNSGTLFRM